MNQSLVKKVEFEGGFIRYKLPNSIQRMKLMGRMGVSTQKEKLAKFMEQSELTALALVMEHLRDCGLILEVKAEIDGKEVTDWEEAVEMDEFADPIAEVAGAVMTHVFAKTMKKTEEDQEESAGDEGNEEAQPS
jgi:hypothetical protein